MRVVQAGDGLRFALEPLVGNAAVGPAREEQLDRDFAIQARVFGEVHLAHATGSERGDDFVRTQASTGSERHSEMNLACLAGFLGRDELSRLQGRRATGARPQAHAVASRGKLAIWARLLDTILCTCTCKSRTVGVHQFHASGLVGAGGRRGVNFSQQPP